MHLIFRASFLPEIGEQPSITTDHASEPSLLYSMTKNRKPDDSPPVLQTNEERIPGYENRRIEVESLGSTSESAHVHFDMLAKIDRWVGERNGMGRAPFDNGSAASKHERTDGWVGAIIIRLEDGVCVSAERTIK